jgi:HD-GYP domain-containing protein (c-di-GMP phosphodiesterase class II)
MAGMGLLSLRLGHFVATLALGQDNAFGQPLESQMRSSVLASFLCEAAGHPRALRDTVHWVALLRYIGCTGHAHEVSAMFGDEIALRAQTLVHDAANPVEVIHDAIALASRGRSPAERAELGELIRREGRAWSVHNTASGCEVGDMLVARLGFGTDVREALRFTFERWNGAGFPQGARGEAIPLAMRIVHLAHDMEAIGRLLSPAQALEAARDRRDRTYDPALADLFVERGAAWFEQLGALDPWDAALELEPRPHRMLEGAALDEALTVAADFVDLKSPYMAGHSRRCAALCEEAARRLGLDEGDAVLLRRAALVHDFGTTAVPNSIWDKPGALTRAEFDRVELHPLLTEQMLRRSPLAALSPVASAHHERCDGSGYHRRVRVPAGELAAVLAAVDVYVGLTTERADRPAFAAGDAAEKVRELVARGELAPRPAEAVLAAAGHAGPSASLKRQNPGGLSERELDVLRLTAKGLITKQIADRLDISPKTADRHIQNIYQKIAVSTRAAAALWAAQNGVVH